MHEVMFEYAKQYLDKHELANRRYPFHTRAGHIWRVLGWAQRLWRLEDLPEGFNRQALFCAAAFHDIGYPEATGGVTHAQAGAMMFEQYARRHYFDEEMTRDISYLIANHSKKELLGTPGTPMELVLLMEADLLENTGALAIAWDCMSEGGQPAQSFEKTLKHILDTQARLPDKNPMVTPAASRIWDNKLALIDDFASQLAVDINPIL